MDPENITFAGILFAVVTGLAVAFRQVFAWLRDDVWSAFRGWGEGFYETTIETQKKLQETSVSNAESITVLARESVNISEAGKAHCDYLRADVGLRKDLTEDEQEKLITLIDRIEQGLTK